MLSYNLQVQTYNFSLFTVEYKQRKASKIENIEFCTNPNNYYI